ncbi:MarR family winged helix-turn-helix transcriptional regulator [Actinomycetospora endophytica]|uniref:MarR family winged helix-turn-helix transcriptional regulator n=1 Tax=Actinomycetospora endophytica TaxID=2291215 RepID=A0ABS8P619_9PSEU|nr:MarR family winged helix-turn-helix transcriptional regulator [Actinomycetospora endophytica]MCD2192995.1 MarR family winged helix-turn-helix transcriptional regulator [Actinomycetospora endophytica]
MALPVPESAAGPREDIIRLLAGTPEGFSDGELACALADRHPSLNAKAVNHQCRKLAAAGMVERVGTRPVRTRLAAGVDVEAASGPSDTDAAGVLEGHITQAEQASGTSDVPLDEVEPPTPGLPAVQEDILRALTAAAEGLTDNELAAALADRHGDADPKSFNYQCRKLAKAGLVERTARSRDTSIRTRLTPDGEGYIAQAPEVSTLPDVPLEASGDATTAASLDEGHTTHPAEVSTLPDVPLEADDDGAGAGWAPAVGTRNGTAVRSRRPRHRAKTPSDDVARMRRSERDGDDPDEPLLRFLPFASAASARTALRERMAERAALRRVPEPSDEVVVPTRDVLQGWSRTQNVAAAVADWITRHGGTIHAANASGPAHDLVATVHGSEVHVEVTGWPPEGARSHPTTLAGDWFRAAARAASQRRGASPRGRVVIALPDTRRYRALAGDDAETLRRARAEVWFVDASGEIQRS